MLQFNPELFPSPAIPDLYFTYNQSCNEKALLLLFTAKGHQLKIKHLPLFWVFSILPIVLNSCFDCWEEEACIEGGLYVPF